MMKTIRLGKTGVEVSALCFGIMHLGSREDKKKSYRLLDQYYDAGGSFVDTANIYSFWVSGCKGGESEAVLGEWMKSRCNRSKLFIASKVGLAYQDVKAGLNASQIESECEKSLKRLCVETIDLYYAHLDDRSTPIEETMKAFDRLCKAGKIRFLGASNFMPWRMEESHWISQRHNWADYCCIQQRYTYLRPNPGGRFTPQLVANEELIDYCHSRNLTLLAYSPLLSGAYTRTDRHFPKQYIGHDTNDRIEVLKKVANKINVTVNQLIYAWMIQNTTPIIPLMAASTSLQMQENLGALEVELSDELIAELNNACTGGSAW